MKFADIPFRSSRASPCHATANTSKMNVMVKGKLWNGRFRAMTLFVFGSMDFPHKRIGGTDKRWRKWGGTTQNGHRHITGWTIYIIMIMTEEVVIWSLREAKKKKKGWSCVDYFLGKRQSCEKNNSEIYSIFWGKRISFLYRSVPPMIWSYPSQDPITSRNEELNKTSFLQRKSELILFGLGSTSSGRMISQNVCGGWSLGSHPSSVWLSISRRLGYIPVNYPPHVTTLG